MTAGSLAVSAFDSECLRLIQSVFESVSRTTTPLTQLRRRLTVPGPSLTSFARIRILDPTTKRALRHGLSFDAPRPSLGPDGGMAGARWAGWGRMRTDADHAVAATGAEDSVGFVQVLMR